MMLNRIKLINFRKHKDNSVSFEKDLTVVVGENDTGKSSLINAIQIIVNGGSIKISDFYDIKNPLEIELDFDGTAYGIKASFEHGILSQSRYTKYNAREISEKKKNLDSLAEEDLRSFAKILGIKIISTMKVSTVKERLIEKLDNRSNYLDGYFVTDVAKEPDIIIYSLGGIEFDNIEKFVHETFFKLRQKEIWNSPINNLTLEEYIIEKLDSYKHEVEEEISSSGVLDIIKQYIDTVENLEVFPNFDKRDININLSVKLLTKAGENQSVGSFGDGTKRRLTIALLEHKAKSDENKSVYLFDEPDTHLHVKAQNDLLNAFDSISETGNQVIVTTHSPFIMNAVDIRQIRLLNKYRNYVSVKGNIKSEDGKDDDLRAIGIENIHLFFSRKFIIVEGETEEAFLPIAYRAFHGRPLSRDFIKLINTRGISNIPKFAEMMSRFVPSDDVFIFTDNDALPRTQALIDALKASNVYRIGDKEFEDAFQPEVVYRAWADYVGSLNVDLGPYWTSDAIQDIYFDPAKKSEGVSNYLAEKNSQCSVRLDKISMGTALGRYCKEQHLPQEITTLFRVLSSSIE